MTTTTYADLTAMSPRELREFAERHPEEFRRLTETAAAEREAAQPAVTRVGFWRPLAPRSQWADALVPEIAREPDCSLTRHYREALDALAEGRHCSLYISEDEPRRAGAATREDYLRLRLAEAAARAAADFALPVPAPGSLDQATAERLAAWLDGGTAVESYRGRSVCRICGAANGAAEMERDGYRYPSGLAHYVREHRCAVPGLPAAVIGLSPEQAHALAYEATRALSWSAVEAAAGFLGVPFTVADPRLHQPQDVDRWLAEVGRVYGLSSGPPWKD